MHYFHHRLVYHSQLNYLHNYFQYYIEGMKLFAVDRLELLDVSKVSTLASKTGPL